MSAKEIRVYRVECDKCDHLVSYSNRQTGLNSWWKYPERLGWRIIGNLSEGVHAICPACERKIKK